MSKIPKSSASPSQTPDSPPPLHPRRRLHHRRPSLSLTGVLPQGIDSKRHNISTNLMILGTTMEEALSTQRNICEEFKSTTRLNPKLSLTWTMRKIAKRSCEKRNVNNNVPSGSKTIVRSTSCVPRIDFTSS